MPAEYNNYREVTANLANGLFNWPSDTVKLALVTSSYIPDPEHKIWADVSANEVASGDGYTTGGGTLSGKTAVRGEDAETTACVAESLTFTGLTKTFRYGVLYVVGTKGTLVNPLIGYILFDDTPADVSVAGIDWTVLWSSAGIIPITLA